MLMNLTIGRETKQQAEVTTKFGSVDIAQLTCFALFFLFGGAGNILVLLVVRNKKISHNIKINDYFILSLAIGDLLNIFVSIPVDFYLKFRESPIGSLLCNVLWPLMSTGFFASIFTLTCMAIERHRSICKPLKPRLSEKGLITLLIVIWAAAFTCVLPLVIVAYWDGRACREQWPNESMRLAYSLSIVLLQYIIPLTIIAVAYALISTFLKKSRFRRSAFASVGEQALERATRRMRGRRANENDRVIKNLHTIVIIFAIFILPKQIVWMWYDFGNGDSYSGFGNLLIFCEFFLYIHSMLNPVVYGTILKEYRHGFKKYISIACPCLMVKSNVQVEPRTPDHAGQDRLVPTEDRGHKCDAVFVTSVL